MAADEFIWAPRPGVQPSVTPRVARAQFGDGYEQRQPDGINALLRQYQLTFRHNRTVSMQIDHFFTDRAGVTAFLWTPPDTGVQGKYLCRQWSSQLHATHGDISCTFEEVPA